MEASFLTSAFQDEEVDLGGRDREVCWLEETCKRLGWSCETRFMAAELLDRLLRRVKIPPRYLHHVAAAAVFLAAKIHEEDEVSFKSRPLEGKLVSWWLELVGMSSLKLYTCTHAIPRCAHPSIVATYPHL